MKKNLIALSLVAAAAFTAQNVAAQSATGTVAASATVLASLNVSKVDDLAFGQINPGSASAVTPGAAVGTGQKMGVLKIDHNSDVIVAASVPTVLPNRVGNGNGSVKTSYLQVGGSISAANTTNRMPGTYTGNVVFTITATY